MHTCTAHVYTHKHTHHHTSHTHTQTQVWCQEVPQTSMTYQCQWIGNALSVKVMIHRCWFVLSLLTVGMWKRTTLSRTLMGRTSDTTINPKGCIRFDIQFIFNNRRVEAHDTILTVDGETGVQAVRISHISCYVPLYKNSYRLRTCCCC